MMVLQPGIEPGTFCLQDRRSTDELQQPKAHRTCFGLLQQRIHPYPELQKQTYPTHIRGGTPYLRMGPTWISISSPVATAVAIIFVKLGRAMSEELRGKIGKASGIITPSREIRMAPLMKSWAKAIGLCCFS